eukprot:5938282-Prymnesium_polylepis.1
MPQRARVRSRIGQADAPRTPLTDCTRGVGGVPHLASRSPLNPPVGVSRGRGPSRERDRRLRGAV